MGSNPTLSVSWLVVRPEKAPVFAGTPRYPHRISGGTRATKLQPRSRGEWIGEWIHRAPGIWDFGPTAIGPKAKLPPSIEGVL